MSVAWRSRARGAVRGAVRSVCHVSVLALVIASVHVAQLAAEDEYRLGPEDRVRLKIFEWRASRDEVFGWEALNDEYAVGATGQLALPMIGHVAAAGFTQEELASTISQQLATQMGIGRTLTVALEIVEYRPFYITGAVAQPGAYAYRPGLTVLKAASLAGGLPTRQDDTQRTLIANTGELDVLLLQRDAAEVRLARLQAELADKATLDVPPWLAQRSAEPTIDRLLEQEQAILAARRDAYDTRLAALQRLHADLQTEVPAQEALLATVELQRSSLREELDLVSPVVTGRDVRAMEREIAKLDGERLRAEASLLRSRQEVSRAQIDIIELRTQHSLDLTAEMRDVQEHLDRLERQIETTEDLVDSAELGNPLAQLWGKRRLRPVYTILRNADGHTIELPAEEVTSVEPGDTIKVDLQREAGSGPESAM